VPRPAAAIPSAVEVGGCREQHSNDHPEGRDRMQGKPRTREPLDHHGPPPVRQPGYLREARGFASPPRDGFAIVDRPSSGVTLTDVNRLPPARPTTPEAYSDGPGRYILRVRSDRVDIPL